MHKFWVLYLTKLCTSEPLHVYLNSLRAFKYISILFVNKIKGSLIINGNMDEKIIHLYNNNVYQTLSFKLLLFSHFCTESICTGSDYVIYYSFISYVIVVVAIFYYTAVEAYFLFYSFSYVWNNF